MKLTALGLGRTRGKTADTPALGPEGLTLPALALVHSPGHADFRQQPRPQSISRPTSLSPFASGKHVTAAACCLSRAGARPGRRTGAPAGEFAESAPRPASTEGAGVALHRGGTRLSPRSRPRPRDVAVGLSRKRIPKHSSSLILPRSSARRPWGGEEAGPGRAEAELRRGPDGVGPNRGSSGAETAHQSCSPLGPNERHS